MTSLMGYHPDRVRRLRDVTIGAIEALAAIRSNDPAADEAVLVARNARRNLEDTWMPLLGRITASDTLLAPVTGLRAEWAATTEWITSGPLDELTDAELLAEIARLDEEVPVVHDDASAAELDRWLDSQRPLAAELAGRLSHDPGFADQLVLTMYASPLAGMLVGSADVPAEVRADVLTAALAHPWWESGWEMDKYAGAANTLLASLLDDPARCLDVLGRDGAAAALAGWPPLDQDLVADFVVAGLQRAPRADAARLPAGYAVLGELIGLANERPLDGDGFEPGMAAGLARSIAVYVPTFIPGLENEHAPVVVKSHGVDEPFDLTLGSREEVVDLFGAMVRSPAAQDELGRVLDAAIRDALGPDPRVRIGDVAEFAELLELAATNEDDELAMAAAARQESMLRVGGLIGLGVAVGTALGGVSAAYRSVTGYTSASLNRAVARTVDADTAGGRRLRAIAYQSMQVEACRRFATDPALRGAVGADGVDTGRLRTIEQQLDDIAAMVADPDVASGRRQRAILNLVEDVREAGGGPYLDEVLEENSVDDLNEAGHAADR